MLRIFVSYASPDAVIADQLANDLKNVGHEVYIDSDRLQMGEDIPSFMNDGIRSSSIIIIIFSASSAKARWQDREVSAALCREVEQRSCRVIVLRLDDTELPPLLATKAYGSIASSKYDETFKRLVSELAPLESSTSIFNKALIVNSSNPFWRVRAEYFEQGMPRLLAEAFSPLDAAKMALLEEMMPCFLEGSRGTGKTMLLMSLRARVLSSRSKASRSISSLFGFYLKLAKPSASNRRGGIAVSGRCDV
jgi:TIR domain-containing protein